MSRSTSTTCPNCQTFFASVEVEYDGHEGYAVLEVTPCTECGVALCRCCSQVHADCCGQIICSEHAIAVTSEGSPRIDRFCPTCYAAMLAEEAEAERFAARCPECAGTDLRGVRYDFGTDPETGYREAGERFACRTCGATGDVSEVIAAPEMPSAKPMGVAEAPERETRKQA